MDAEQFVDDGNKDAGMEVNVEVEEALPVEEGAVEEAAEKTAEEAAEKTAEKPSDDRSFLVPKQEQEQEQQQETETMIPLHVHAKLRAKNRDLKEQLEQAQTRPAGGKADVTADPLAEFEDDDFLTAGQIRAVRTYDQTVAKRQQQEANEQTAQVEQRKKFETFLLASETAVKTDYPDYNAVMTAADEFMTDHDFQSAMQAKNPGKALYAKAKQIVNNLDIEVQTPAATKQKKEASQGKEEVLQTDTEVYEEIFGENSAT